ncbi:MAG: RHS repeat-associated core domain-containing protein, partial [Vicinamibacteria bacterium]
SQLVFDRTYNYFDTGDVEQIVDGNDANNNRIFEYDDLSRLTKATGPFNSGNTAILEYHYDPTGNLRFMDWRTTPLPALGRELVYDSSSPQPHAVNEIREGGSSTFLTYDANGNPLFRGNYSTGFRQFNWDAENRLTSLTGLPNNGADSYFYDDSGDRVRRTHSDASGTTSLIYVGGDFEWDPATNATTKYLFVGGERVASIGSSYTPAPAEGPFAWRLQRLLPSDEVLGEMGVSAFGVLFFLLFLALMRWRLAHGRGWAIVLLKRGAVAALCVIFFVETSVVPAQAQCLVGPAPVYRYYVSDHLGSASVIIDGDGADAGTVLEKIEYRPFGSTLSDTGGPDVRHRFTGQERDKESGLSYYGARYYDPSIGRFLSPDSLVPDPFDSQAFNRYSYVRNNPLNRIDPSGNFDWCFGLCGSDEPPSDVPPGGGRGGGGGPPDDDPGGGDSGRTIYSSEGGEREK